MTRVICLGNQKGGCAKTSDCLNIAYSFANTKGYKVLLIDLDSQGSASLNVGINVADEDINTIDELLGAYVKKEITSFDWEDVKNFIYTPTYLTRKRNGNNKWETAQQPFGFDIIPSALPLSLVELQMALVASQNTNGKIYLYYLDDLIQCIKENADYDYIIIDTPPALGSLSMNAMMASDGVIVPSNLDIMSFRGIQSFKESADYVQSLAKQKGRDHRGILGILLSLYSERRSVDKALEEYVHEFYPTPTFQHQIRESSDAKRANAEGVLFAQINKKAKEDFDLVCDEIEFALNDKEGWEKKTEEVWQEIKKSRDEGKEANA